jgi:hypothetical protein
MAEVAIGYRFGGGRNSVPSLFDEQAQTTDRFGEVYKFFAIEMQCHRAIGKVKLSTLTEDGFGSLFPPQDTFHLQPLHSGLHLATVIQLAVLYLYVLDYRRR